MSDFLYSAWCDLNTTLRQLAAWRSHHLWCQAMAFRSANSQITFSEGTITVAACKCGLGRAYDSVGPIGAGMVISSSAFKRHTR